MDDITPAVLALELDRAIQRLRARIRAESGMGTSPWSRSQLLALDRLVTGPPTTTSDLAAAEYVRPQSMAATLAPLLDAGLVTRHRDPDDGRRVLIVPTDAGRDALRSVEGDGYAVGFVLFGDDDGERGYPVVPGGSGPAVVERAA